MSRFMAAIYDSFMAPTERACLQRWRRELLGGATGRVLEIGAGTGANLLYFPADLVQLHLSEPDPHMASILRQKLAAADRSEVSVCEATAEALPFAADSFDTVAATLLLCSVPSPAAALAEIRRVLSPEGCFIFLEHVAAEPSTRRYRTQRTIEPVWGCVAGNCHLTRDTEASILAAGFEFERIERASMRKALPFLRPTIRGVARPR